MKQDPKLPAPMRPAQEKAYTALLEILATVVGDLPCQGENWRDWTSEVMSERKRASKACLRCPALRPCRDYGIKHEVGGTWGGVSLTIPLTKSQKARRDAQQQLWEEVEQ